MIQMHVKMREGHEYRDTTTETAFVVEEVTDDEVTYREIGSTVTFTEAREDLEKYLGKVVIHKGEYERES